MSSWLTRGAVTSESNRRRIARSGFTPKGDPVWTQEEIAQLKLLYGTMTYTQMSSLIGRSYSSIRNKAQEKGLTPKRHVWTGAEITRLRRLRAQGASLRDIAAAFPGYTHCSVSKVVSYHKLPSPKRSFKPTGVALVDQIRSRAYDLGYSMPDLDDLARSKRYFQHGNWTRGGANHRAIAKAVAALDGELMAVWH